MRQARVHQLEEFIREVCKIEPPQQSHPYLGGADDDENGNGVEDPFYPSQVVFNNERRYPAAVLTDDYQQPQMLNADEKINELGSLLE